jgi:hypothetical protein
MDFDWLWKGFAVRLLWIALGSLGGTRLLDYLKSKYPAWSASIRQSIGVFASFAVIFVVLEAHYELSQGEPMLTMDHPKETITEWLQKDSASSTRELSQKEAPDSLFAIAVTSPENIGITIGQTKEYPRDLHLVVTEVLSPQGKAALSALSKRQSSLLALEVGTELAKENMAAAIADDWSKIKWSRAILLTSNMREEEFLRQVDEVERSSIVVHNMIMSGIANAMPQPTAN